MQVSSKGNGTVIGEMGNITLFLVSQEIMEWRLEIAHTSDDEQRQDPQ